MDFPPDPFQVSALWSYSTPRDPQLESVMTFACRAHGMTSSLTQQTFSGGGGEGGSHEIFINRREISNFSASSKAI